MITLYRYNYEAYYTQGALIDEKGFISDTLELSWKENAHNISCIPEGLYEIAFRRDDTSHVKEGYNVNAVMDRTGILIHVANYVSELKGCIAVGTKYGSELYNSADAFAILRDRAKDFNILKIVGRLL